MRLSIKAFILLSIFILPNISQAQISNSDLAAYTENLSNLDLSEKYNNSQLNNTDRFYLNAGLGAGTEDIAFLAGVSYQFSGANLLTLRTSVTTELILMVQCAI